MTTWRDYRAERRERDSFVLLQHIYTITESDTERAVSGVQAGEYLCFRAEETRELLEHLVHVGCLAPRGEGDAVSITPSGINYIERLAWRRHSIRAD